MVTFHCDRCGFESNNRYDFGDKHFRWVGKFSDEQAPSGISHLCVKCQKLIEKEFLVTVAKLIGLPDLNTWNEIKGVL